MQFWRGLVRGRNGLLVIALICFGVTAAPVFADTVEGGDSPIPPPQQETTLTEAGAELPAGVHLPTEQDMEATLDHFQETEEVKKEELEAPAAVEAREASQHAYEGLTGVEAEELLQATFPEVLAGLNSDPARWLSDAKLDRPLGETTADVTSEGKTSLYEGTVPVLAENEQGEEKKVDLELEKNQEGFVPKNPLVEVTIGEMAAEGVEVGGVAAAEEPAEEESLTITQVGAEESTAQPFGDKNVFFSEVEGEGSDTDLLVAPVSQGAELFDLLRSADSPEALRFDLGLPEGARVTPVSGGAEVVSAEGVNIALISPPHAVDAQGAQVPVTMMIEGDTLVLHVEMQDREVAYPVLVDPEIYQDWGWWYEHRQPQINGIWAWGWNQSQSGWLHYGYENPNDFPGWGGLFMSSEPGNLPGSQWGQFYYSAPNAGTYLSNAVINPYWRANRSCSAPNPYPQPYDYDGMWNETSWNRLLYNQANELGWSQIESWGRAFVIGMGTSSGASIPCWRNIGIGGVGIWLEDWQYPTIGTVSGVPTTWVAKNNVPRYITASASDEGLGVRQLRLIAPGGKVSPWNLPWCSGTWESRCANSATGTVTYETSQFPLEGETKIGLVVEDPTQKTWGEEFPVYLDGQPPTVNLSGQLATVTQEEGKTEKSQSLGSDKLRLPVYKLVVKSEDEVGGTARSGVKEIKLFLDGSSTPLTTKTSSCSWACPQTSTLEYSLGLTGLTEGKHILEIEAVDQVGNAASRKERKIEFEYIPATGMKEEYVLQHFVLPDGHNYAEEPEYRGPEIAVNVTNGNVVFQQRDLKANAQRGNLEMDRVYNSQQPTAKDGQWGHGWTLAQAPELKVQGSEASGTLLRTGAITNPVDLPESVAHPAFNKKLHAEIAKTASGGYEVDYETTPEVSVFTAAGQIQETKIESGPATGVTAGGVPSQEPTAPVYVNTFGSAGTGNGQFAHPGDVALDPKGNLWVADVENNRLQEFNQKGEFLKVFGAAGSGNGQFIHPKSIAFGAKGDMWVADAGNNRLQEFNEKGEFLKTVGSAGSGNGQFSGAESISIDPKGDIWVADTYNYRVQELNEKGEFIEVVNPSGLGAIEPTGLDADSHGNVWVADWAHNRVVEFNQEGALVRSFGSEGTGSGKFRQPDTVTIDSRGDVWVGDQNNERVQEFNSKGEYLTQFGSAGSGAGQFNLGYPLGIAADSRGNLWIADSRNNRVQRWEVPGYAPTFSGAFGTAGTGNGQFAHPGDVAVDAEGSAWVVDENNNRVEKFNAAGEYVAKFGSTGTGNGQFNRPTSLAISPQGNVWVADAGSCRLEEFNSKGEYLAKTGACGTGNGQFGAIEGVAISPQGNIWVADTYHSRLQELNEKGEFIRAVGSAGTGAGQLCEPTGIDIGAGGNVFTTEWCNNRVSEFNETGEFVRKFGAAGTGNGQFAQPDAVAVDQRGNVWIGDQNNERVQEFTTSGEYVTQFGSAGSGNGQFSFGYPMGIAADSKGHLWVTDTGNNRVQKFTAADSIGSVIPAQYGPATIKYTYSGANLTKMALKDEASATEPAMNVSLTGGLTTSVAAGTAGTATLGYEGSKLTSVSAPQGETKYEYDTNNRLKKVTLPNGTWASIVYDTYGRATEVTVRAEGVSKTTHFWYGLEPHESRVWGGGNPEIVYSIGEDGSVFKWNYAEVPPTITSISGSLWGNRNSTTAVEKNDQTLYVASSSPHEIASMKVIENGTTLVAETTCEDNASPPDHHCDHPPPLEWITNPAAHAPGQLNLEVVVTDFLGHTAAEKFFVTIPQQPAPEPGAPERPNFESVRQFREAYGLDRERPLTTPQMNTLVLELLYEWELGNSTALAAVNNWGVPMRAPELAEMESRKQIADQAAELIPQWAEEHAAGTYGGMYIDNRNGGQIYVGFTENQHASVEAVKGIPGLLAPTLIYEFPTPPTRSVASLQATAPTVTAAITGEPSIAALTTGVHVSPEGSSIVVGATNPIAVREFVTARFGAGAPITVQGAPQSTLTGLRYAKTGPIVGGSALIAENHENCTAGWGTRAPSGSLRGQTTYKYFVLTAGHCYPLNELVGRQYEKLGGGIAIGTVRRSGWKPGPSIDGAAINLEDENLRSHSVLGNNPLQVEPIQGAQTPKAHRYVCWSGVEGGYHCGMVMWREELITGGHTVITFLVNGPAAEGDSGGPVWDPNTHKAVGTMTSNTNILGGACTILPTGSKMCPQMEFSPLLPVTASPGVLPYLGLEILSQG
jgi:YD repeat-containing protein